jgi:hypothetical protein
VAFADYFDRGAVAAAQVIAGFDEQAFKEALSTTTVGIALGPDAATTAEGRFLTDLSVRVLARLYPTLAITAAPDAQALGGELNALARAINPAITLADDPHVPIGIVVGDADAPFETRVFAGSDRWHALIGTDSPRPIGDSANPFGAGAAACLACANVFRLLFLGGGEQLDGDLAYSTYTGETAELSDEQPELEGELPSAVLVGCGAIGNGAAWALARAPLSGELYLVDPQTIELSNLQRYVLAERNDVDGVKVDVVGAAFTNTVAAIPHQASWADFVSDTGHAWRHALVALDTATDRRAVQGSLPEWVVNAWTQPGDLGVSLHGRFSGAGACLACLYLPTHAARNEDEIIAEALGIPEHQQGIRHLLHTGESAPADLLDTIAERLSVSRETLAAFEDRSVRDLYVEGLCAGAVLPLDRLGLPQREVHVPLAHQSALAGVQLAASFVRQTRESPEEPTEVTRINVLRPLGENVRQPARKSDPRCLCADADYVDRYTEKWALAPK